MFMRTVKVHGPEVPSTLLLPLLVIFYDMQILRRHVFWFLLSHEDKNDNDFLHFGHHCYLEHSISRSFTKIIRT